MTTRPAAVAGMFYPAPPAVLRQSVEQLLAAVGSTSGPQPKALIVPHAGYIYSGSTAARAYALLVPWAKALRRVVLLGPTHRVAVNGLALPEATAFATPLGEVGIDAAAVAAIADLPQVVRSDVVHAQEHSLEVHLPFLQTVLADFELLPLAVGRASPEAVAEVLERLWGGPETLILISSDLSHFLPYANAQQIDASTCQRILQLQNNIQPKEACGAFPVNGLLLAARQHGLRPQLLAACNSGDTAGDRQRVVGYAAFAFAEGNPVSAQTTNTLGDSLLKLARQAINRHFGQPTATFTVDLPELQKSGASFVTLTQNGQLRGCIGSLQAWRPLAQDVQQNALAAALRDPRFKPLTAEELARTRVEVSLLTAPEPMQFSSEADLLGQLRPGVDGIILSAGPHRATFLPQVWEQLPTPQAFMAQLKRKAGLAADYWGDEVRVERYGVQKWKEKAC